MIIIKTGGSDSPIPYVVDETGITLPEGQVFEAHGHVNIKYLAPNGDLESSGIHFDPNNNHPGGAWIGENHIPWSAFGLEEGDCVTWIQIHGFNQHYGEGGQESFCLITDEPPALPPEFECPEGTVPGWLNSDGEPTSCLNDYFPPVDEEGNLIPNDEVIEGVEGVTVSFVQPVAPEYIETATPGYDFSGVAIIGVVIASLLVSVGRSMVANLFDRG